MFNSKLLNFRRRQIVTAIAGLPFATKLSFAQVLSDPVVPTDLVIPTVYKLISDPTQETWGHAVVCDKNGIVIRDYKLSLLEHTLFKQQISGPPPGMTSAEWNNPGSHLAGKVLTTQDALVDGAGRMLIKAAESLDVNGFIVESMVLLEPIEYSVAGDSTIGITAAAIAFAPILQTGVK